MSADVPATEAADPQTAGLDRLAVPELVAVLVAGQRAAVDAVSRECSALARIVSAAAEQLERGGRLHYVGAGTSGRLAMLDASEMPPTFGVPVDLVCAHIAGGRDALVSAVEGAEDDSAAGRAAVDGHVLRGDVVVGISASGNAPFVVAAIETARAAGAYTVAIVNNPAAALVAAAHDAVVLSTGSEPIAGSTRMKAGTAQKIALNTISTAVMIRLGKVYDNLMVDVVATNEKLRRRARGLVSTLTGVDDSRASVLLDAAGGRVKVAVVMERRGVSASRACELLDAEKGRLRSVL